MCTVLCFCGFHGRMRAGWAGGHEQAAMIPFGYGPDEVWMRFAVGETKNGCIMYCFSAVFRNFVRDRDLQMKEFYRFRKKPLTTKNFRWTSFVELCRKNLRRVTAHRYLRICNLTCLEKNVKNVRKCAGTSETPAQSCADFSKRGQKQYIIHT